MIHINELSVGFDKNKPIVASANAYIKRGSFTSVLGVNGCGKTTLLSTIAGLLPMISGDVIIDGASITKYARKELAKKLAFLPQSSPVRSIRVDLLLSCARYPYTGISHVLSADDRAAIARAVELTDISAFLDRDISELSGGERQRVYFAMALAQDTPLILLDEPAAHLDAAQSFELFRLILAARDSGKTIVAATHDIAGALGYSDELIFVDGGSLVFQGDADQALASGIAERIFNIRLVKAEGGCAVLPMTPPRCNKTIET